MLEITKKYTENRQILSGKYPDGEAERRIRALKGELYSFDAKSFREDLISQGIKEKEANILVEQEREKIRKANEKAKAEVMEEEYEKGVEILEKEMERQLGDDEQKAA